MANRKPQRSNAPAQPPTDPNASAADRLAAKSAKFREIGAKRMNRLLLQIRLLGNLSNSGSYAYTDDQLSKMKDAIGSALDIAFARFARTPGKKEDTFTL